MRGDGKEVEIGEDINVLGQIGLSENVGLLLEATDRQVKIEATLPSRVSENLADCRRHPLM